MSIGFPVHFSTNRLAFNRKRGNLMFTIDKDEYDTIRHLLSVVSEHIQEKRETSERWSKYFDCQVDAMLKGVDLVDRLDSEFAQL
jgi:hypothetical protein